MTESVSQAASDLHDRSLVADWHIHPSLKTCLWNRTLSKRHKPGGAMNPFSMRADLPKLREGGVNVLLSSIYLPERDLLSDCRPLKVLRHIAPRRIKRLFEGSQYGRTIEMIDQFERVVQQAELDDGARMEIAKSASELNAVLQRGNIAALHAIEGAHSLDGNLAHVQKLFDRGICLMTLAHFYYNGVAYPVDGVPPSVKILGCFKHPKDLSKGLTDFGRQVVEEMLRLGMLVDLTHCTPKARQDVLDICRNRRPLVMTHVGARRFADRQMNPTDHEIKSIADTGGAVSVIFMNYWLADTHEKKGLDLVVKTMKHIRQVGGIDCVGFGSDFDGFTDPPDDLSDPSMLPSLTDAMLRGGFSDTEAEKILGLNLRRMLRDGWGKG